MLTYLDVVVEGAVSLLELAQQVEGGRVAKVLELEQHLRAVLGLGGVHELLHELLEALALLALLAQAHVERVREERLVVGTAVEHYGQAHVRRHTSARRVESEFADRDAHAVHAQVTEAQDALLQELQPKQS